MSLIDGNVVADLLRQAAAIIRDTDTKATRGPWVNLSNGDRIIRDPHHTNSEDPEYVVDEPLQACPANGDHIALFDPVTAAAVRQLLDELATDFQARGHLLSEHLDLSSIVLAATILRKTGHGHDLLAFIPEQPIPA